MPKIKEELKEITAVETEFKPEPVVIENKEVKKVKLISRNDFDTFVKYYDQEFCISPRGEVICNEEGIKNTLPAGIFKLTI